MISNLEPYTILWSTVSQFYDKFSSWMNGPFMKLNPEEVETDTNDAFRRLYKLTKLFGAEAKAVPLAIAEEGKNKVVVFQGYLPLISAICNPGLRERHWQQMAEVVGFEIKRDEVTSLKRLLDHDIAAQLSKVREHLHSKCVDKPPPPSN